MLDQLQHLPYVTYWLPIAVALTVAVPFLWFVRPGRARGRANQLFPAIVSAPTTKAVPDLPQSKYAAEQRRSFRRGGNSIGVLYKYEGQNTAPASASVLDRSMGGMCLLCHESLAIGTVLTIRPTNAEDIIPWVDVEVCTCRHGEECFEVGCRFIKAPPYSIMLLFG
jgi:hypothetical protein